MKSLYTFIICDCDAAGFWAPDFEIASIYTGQKISLADFETYFSGKFVKIDNGEYFFPDFIQRQYDGKLRSSNPAHKNVIKKLEDHGFLVDFFSFEDDKKGGDFYLLNKGALEGLPRGFEASKDKDKDKDMVMVKEKETRTREKSPSIEDRIETFRKEVYEYCRDNMIETRVANEFINYWTEPNQSKKKFRAEMQKTFAIPNRLGTWRKIDNERSSGKGVKKSRGSQLLDKMRQDELNNQNLLS